MVLNRYRKIYGSFLWLLFISLGLKAQDINQLGFLPILSHTLVAPKLDVNIFGVSKITAFDQAVGGSLYPASVLEVYFQLQASLKLKNNITISSSLGFQRNNPFRDSYINEHRLGQQLVWAIKLREGHLYQRFRIEERLIQNSDHQDYQLGTRSRYQLGLVHNFGASPYFINLSNEIFAIPSGTRNSFLSENIAYAGIGRKAKIGNIEVGIAYNTIVRNPNHDLRNLLLLQLMLSSSSTRMKEKKESIMLHMRHF